MILLIFEVIGDLKTALGTEKLKLEFVVYFWYYHKVSSV